jgi:hypothetical protein
MRCGLTAVVRTDHKFVVRETNAPQTPLSPFFLTNKWKETRGKNSSAIVVGATASGGIRAAAWTAEVMSIGSYRSGELLGFLAMISNSSAPPISPYLPL